MRKRKKQFGNQLHARSRITNGHSVLPTIDHRSSWARRYRDLNAAFLSDLGQDEDALSEGQRALSKHAAAMCVELEFLTVRFAANGGADIHDLNVFQRVYNTLRRGIESLGVSRGRIARDVTGITLGQVLRAGIEQQQQQREEAEP